MVVKVKGTVLMVGAWKGWEKEETMTRRNSTLTHGLAGGHASVHRPRRKDRPQTGLALLHRDVED
jgi:hypothetical protein